MDRAIIVKLVKKENVFVAVLAAVLRSHSQFVTPLFIVSYICQQFTTNMMLSLNKI